MSLPVFSHEPLPDLPRHIRLLEILQGDFGQHVICALSTWGFDNAPPYVAISYTWGDPNSTTDITVNERRMLVRKNCEYALQQVFHNTKSQQQYVWLDAICIDQSNIRERGHQVAFMGELYKRSSQVFACVGPHENDSEQLVLMCKKKEGLLKHIYSWIRGIESTGGNKSWEPQPFLDRDKRSVFRAIFAMSISTRRRLARAFKAFTNRSYFTRVWVLQELQMGRSVTYVCGPDILMSSLVLALSHLFEAWIWGHGNCQAFDSGTLVERLAWYSYAGLARNTLGRRTVHSIPNIFESTGPQRASLALASGNLRPRHLLPTLAYVSHLHCADVRDKIYGILSLVDWTPNIKPQPDYGKSVLEVASEVLGLIHQSRHSVLFRSVETLANLFHLSLSHQLVRATMAARNSQITLSLDEDPGSGVYGLMENAVGTQGGHSVVIESGWCSARIYSSSPNKRNKFSVRYSQTTEDGIWNMLLEYNSTTVARVPSNTKIGDLLLYPDAIHRRDNLRHSTGLIARPGQFGQSTIIGGVSTNLYEHPAVQPRQPANFEIHWNPEDALIFYLHAMSSETTIDLVDLRVCKTPGSSFAKGWSHENYGFEDSQIYY